MSYVLTPLIAVVAILSGATASRGAAPPSRPEPFKGIVVSQMAVATTPYGTVYCQPLHGNDPPSVDPGYGFYGRNLPLRWHVAHGAYWGHVSLDSFGFGPSNWLLRGSIRDLFKAAKRPAKELLYPKDWFLKAFPRPIPLQYKRLLGVHTAFRSEVYHDYLPSGPTSIRLFLLTNVGGKNPSSLSPDPTPLVTRTISRQGLDKPVWSFTCWHVRARWVAKDSVWQSESGWQQEGTLDLRFREPFHALSRGDDFYFLTASGKLYRSPKPAKGKHRSLEVVWGDPAKPVTAFITDADKNRTFLFCDLPRKGVNPTVFELASKVRPRSYDPKLFRPGDQGPYPLRKVLGYARVLVDLDLIRVDKPPPRRPR